MVCLQVLRNEPRAVEHMSVGTMLTLAAEETRWEQRMDIVGAGLASFGDIAGDCCICVTIRRSVRVTLSVLLQPSSDWCSQRRMQTVLRRTAHCKCSSMCSIACGNVAHHDRVWVVRRSSFRVSNIGHSRLLG